MCVTSHQSSCGESRLDRLQLPASEPTAVLLESSAFRRLSGDSRALPAAMRTASPSELRPAGLPASIEPERRGLRRPDAAPASRACGSALPASRANENLVGGGGDRAGLPPCLWPAVSSPPCCSAPPPSAPVYAGRGSYGFLVDPISRLSLVGRLPLVQRTPQQRVTGFLGDVFLRRDLGHCRRVSLSHPTRGDRMLQLRGSSRGGARAHTPGAQAI